MKQSKVIGITGGIGAGKSRVLRFLSEEYSIDLIEADLVGAELMEKGQAVYEALLREYGDGILSADGSIDRGRLSSLAFRDEESQRRINALEHPIIRDEIIKRIRASRFRFILLEAALLQEGELLPVCDEVWYVRADPETRIRRLMDNRGYSREKCGRILSLQHTDADFSGMADLTLDNSGDFSVTEQRLRTEMRRLGVRRKAGV